MLFISDLMTQNYDAQKTLKEHQLQGSLGFQSPFFSLKAYIDAQNSGATVQQ